MLRIITRAQPDFGALEAGLTSGSPGILPQTKSLPDKKPQGRGKEETRDSQGMIEKPF